MRKVILSHIKNAVILSDRRESKDDRLLKKRTAAAVRFGIYASLGRLRPRYSSSRSFMFSGISRLTGI